MNLIRTTLLYVVGSLLVCVGFAADSAATVDAAPPHAVDAVAGINVTDSSICAGDSLSGDSVVRVAPRSASTIRDVSAQLSASYDSTIERSACEVGEEIPLDLDSYDACNVAVRRRWSRRRDRGGCGLDPALT